MSRLGWTAAAALCLMLGGACTFGGATTKANNVVPPSPSLLPASPSPDPLKIASLPFHSGEVGVAYAATQLTATGGTTPYNWTVAAGTFPPGLVLDSDGSITGTNSTAGNFSFTVSVTDADEQSMSGPGSISVLAQMAVAPLCARGCSIGRGCQVCGTFGTVKNGATPYTYRIAGGAVPAGMTWGGLAVNGPFPAGSYSLSVQVTDALGAQATVSANWSVYNPASLKSGGDCIDTTQTPTTCAVRWSYAGGHPAVAPKLLILGYLQNCNVQGLCMTPKAPPPGWATSIKSGVITISAGSAACTVQYIGTVRLALSDGTSCATTSQSNEQDLKVDLEYAC